MSTTIDSKFVSSTIKLDDLGIKAGIYVTEYDLIAYKSIQRWSNFGTINIVFAKIIIPKDSIIVSQKDNPDLRTNTFRFDSIPTRPNDHELIGINYYNYFFSSTGSSAKNMSYEIGKTYSTLVDINYNSESSCVPGFHFMLTTEELVRHGYAALCHSC